MLPIEQTVSFRIALNCRAHRNFVAVRLAQFGLFIGQELILVQLWKEEGLTQVCLAERVGIEASTMTKALQRLERYGLIERKPDPEDTRASLVFLTEQGRNLEPQLTATWNEVEQRTLAGFSPQEREQFSYFLQRVVINLS